jgi:hypothetical protein
MRPTIALATAALLAACSTVESPLATTDQPAPPPALDLSADGFTTGVADFEEFEICKYGSEGVFAYTIVDHTNGNAVTTGTVGLAEGACKVIATKGGAGATITVTETTMPFGFQLNRVNITVVTEGPSTASRTESGPSVTELIKGGEGIQGVLAEFFNARRETAGGQGCTPGYWKQPHHFDSWPAGYAPIDLFSAHVENAFPGMTLLDVLSQGGGKLIARGRHTVAALLNGASAGVSYDLTAAQVVNEFNATYPSSNYGPQHGRFATFNEQGCPLN